MSSSAQHSQFIYPPPDTPTMLICAAMGGFANHLRWLILADKKYSFSALIPEYQYTKLASPEWPTYRDYCQHNFTDVDPNIIDEINTKINHDMTFFYFRNTEEKLNFINTQVYPDSRTWQNWLNVEWKYRKSLDNLVPVTHIPMRTVSTQKSISLIMPPELALKTYIKFNTNLNNISMDEFIFQTKWFNTQILKLDPKTNLVLSSETLFSPVLDRDFYSKIVKWADLDGDYEFANYIHTRWYNLQRRAEQEIVKFLSDLYNEPGLTK